MLAYHEHAVTRSASGSPPKPLDRPPGGEQLLLIDDDVALTQALHRYLRHLGYRVAVAHSGEEGLAAYWRLRPDLVILDIIMPGLGGLEVCRRIEEHGRVPLIILTVRDDESSCIYALRLGADDYITKPFSLKELEAHIEAVLRRYRWATSGQVLYDDGRLRIEAGSLQVLRDGMPLKLTKPERRLLFLLAEQPGRLFTPDQILHQVWGPVGIDHPEYVKLYIWRVRRKVEPGPGQHSYIQTVHGLGYRFVPATARRHT